MRDILLLLCSYASGVCSSACCCQLVVVSALCMRVVH